MIDIYFVSTGIIGLLLGIYCGYLIYPKVKAYMGKWRNCFDCVYLSDDGVCKLNDIPVKDFSEGNKVAIRCKDYESKKY